MGKYIIKNCENLLYCTTCKDYECALADEFPYKRKCADTDNCNLKKLVEKCKDIIRIYECYDTDYAQGKVNCAGSILQLFDIEEVSE